MRNERGFTLLEVLIAIVIAAVVSGVLMRSAMTGIGTAREAGSYETAVALARSHLALLGRDMASLPAEQHGTDGPFAWRGRVRRDAVADSGGGIVNWCPAQGRGAGGAVRDHRQHRVAIRGPPPRTECRHAAPRLRAAAPARNTMRRAAGFTLIEILVVLVVLGFLMVGLTQGMRLGVQVWDRQRRSLDAISELDATDRALRGLIEQMDPGGRIEMSDIAGTNRTLRFITRMPEAAAALQTRRAEVMLLVDPRHRLMLRWTPSPHGTPLVPATRPVETLLLDGVDHIEISYKPTAPAAPWENTWDSPIPPLLVRVHIAFAADDPRHWPDLVATPMRERGG